ncbi:MAG: hypothetical protein KDH96_07480 [Candidatus Riesia sp.]|nr:hypothetical protein [Candidatus Riesia sp.]
MLVYRLEYKNFGPYRAEEYEFLYKLSWYNRMREEHDTSIIHPGGFVDFDDQFEFDNNSRFACKSIDDIVSWFDEFLFNFAEIGAVIKEYEVIDYAIGKSELQLIFDISTAKLIREINIQQLLEDVTND